MAAAVSLLRPDACISLRAVMTAAVVPLFDPQASPGAVHLRRATIDDLAPLVELENASFAIERMSARQLRSHLESLSAEVFVAIRVRRVVGAAVLFFHRSHRVARLYSIAVAAGERGHGIGDLLLATAEQAARRRGSRALRLEVRLDNRPAQRLYERHGYRGFAVRPAYYQDGMDARRYEKRLDPPAPVSRRATGR